MSARAKWQESGGKARLAVSAAAALQRQNVSVTSSNGVTGNEDADPGRVTCSFQPRRSGGL